MYILVNGSLQLNYIVSNASAVKSINSRRILSFVYKNVSL